MDNFFQVAASDPIMITEVVNAMRDSAAETGLTFADANEYVELALANPELKAALQTRLTQLSAQSGLTLIFYAMGMGFQGAAIFKFKAHKDNPTQVPVGTPIALMFLGAAVLFAPSLYDSVDGILFGRSTEGVPGVDTF